MAWKTGAPSQVESYQRFKKWYLIPPCLTLSIIRYVSRIKWSNPGKGVALSFTYQCSSYWKGSFQVTLNNGRQIYFYTDPMASWVECLPMAQETRVRSQVESYQRLKKWYLTILYLIFSIIRYVSRIKWRNPGGGGAPTPTPRCSSYWKGSLQVTLDYSYQLYIYEREREKHIHTISIMKQDKNSQLWASHYQSSYEFVLTYPYFFSSIFIQFYCWK